MRQLRNDRTTLALARYAGIVLALLGSALAVPAQTIPIETLLRETETILQWDLYRQTGALWKGTQVLYFQPGNPMALHNYRESVEVGNIVLRSDGGLYFSAHAAEQLRKLFRTQRAGPSERTISTIFIDPGHGGKDPGAIGSYQHENRKIIVREKNVVLQAAQLLRKQLQRRYPSKKIILSREKDRFISLPQRAKIANKVKVAPGNTILFISIHVNASLNQQAQGFEVWYLPPDHRRPNLVDAHTVGVQDRHVLSILNTITEEEFTIESVLLARSILSGLQETIGALSRNRGIKQESWYVVRQARMPSVLVELGFISNAEEARRLNSDSYLNNVVTGIYNGIERFVADFEK